jgi:hypothetical protein
VAASFDALLNNTTGGGGGRGRGGLGSVSAWRREKEGRGGWRGGGRLEAADNGPRPSGMGNAVLRGQGSPGADRWATATVPGGTMPGSNGFKIIQI